MVTTSEQMQVLNGTGQGVRRSKSPPHPLQMEISRRSSSVRGSRLSEMYQWRVSLYMVNHSHRMSYNILERETS